MTSPVRCSPACIERHLQRVAVIISMSSCSRLSLQPLSSTRVPSCDSHGKRHHPAQVFERQYGSDLEGSQVYAAYKYPRQDVKAVRPGPAVAAARRFLPDMMEVGHDGSTRRVGPFEMLPGTAAGAALMSPGWGPGQGPVRFAPGSRQC